MKNVLEEYRLKNRLTYRELAHLCHGRSLNAVYRHCQGQMIRAESALIYSRSLGIPLSELRPDLWLPEKAS